MRKSRVTVIAKTIHEDLLEVSYRGQRILHPSVPAKRERADQVDMDEKTSEHLTIGVHPQGLHPQRTNELAEGKAFHNEIALLEAQYATDEGKCKRFVTWLEGLKKESSEKKA
jgi:hypothetical protein